MALLCLLSQLAKCLYAFFATVICKILWLFRIVICYAKYVGCGLHHDQLNDFDVFCAVYHWCVLPWWNATINRTIYRTMRAATWQNAVFHRSRYRVALYCDPIWCRSRRFFFNTRLMRVPSVVFGKISSTIRQKHLCTVFLQFDARCHPIGFFDFA